MGRLVGASVSGVGTESVGVGAGTTGDRVGGEVGREVTGDCVTGT